MGVGAAAKSVTDSDVLKVHTDHTIAAGEGAVLSYVMIRYHAIV